ncbi:MAG: tRNA guanosine(34) transglycosylase Tgt [Minisyncoccia bacterium]
MEFKIEKKLKNNLGRIGVLTTPHGVILTPSFVAVGTKATIKSLNPDQVKDEGTQVVLGNTYHLFLQPGDEIVAKAGGIGKFMNWSGPTMTDSGGFQVFSLGAAYGKNISKVIQITDPSLMIPERFDDSDAPRLAKIGQDGVSFKSHLDGSIHYITPEKSIQIQHNLGADIIFAFDECTSPAEDFKYQEEALNRTHAWAKRCLEEHKKLEELKENSKKIFSRDSHSDLGVVNDLDVAYVAENTSLNFPDVAESTILNSPQALFGIVQGGREEDLRKKSAQVISEMNVDGKKFDGFGIGGSFAKEDMSTAVKWVNEILPEEKPRHLLGIGEPEDLFMGIENGVDLFDCVLPTRLGRNGTIYTKKGKISITNAKYRDDFSPIEDDCECYTCGQGNSLPKGEGISLNTVKYSKAYIAHLFHGKEMLAGTLASIHNLHFIVSLVAKIRQSIIDDNFYEFRDEFLKNYEK